MKNNSTLNVRSFVSTIGGENPIKAENDRKDLLIIQLKAQVFELRMKERDYKVLHEQYIKASHAHTQLVDSKVRGKLSHDV
jgi:hypothetical protein